MPGSQPLPNGNLFASQTIFVSATIVKAPCSPIDALLEKENLVQVDQVSLYTLHGADGLRPILNLQTVM